MLDIDTLEKYDKGELYKVYDMWPKIARESYESNYPTVDFETINHIVFAGMGGSGALGDIFSAILSKTGLHVSIVKGYVLPKTVNADTLVVLVSVSGNTVETNTILDSAKQFTRKIVAFSSGGKMEDYCKEKNIEYRKIPLYHSPRASFTAFLYSMLNVLSEVLPISKDDIYDSIKEMEETGKEICSSNLSDNNSSLSLAKWITGLPVIYYPWGLQAAAIRFKSSLQENAKIQALAEDVIEACHNGIVPWEKKSSNCPILIQGDKDYFKTKERWEIIKEYYNQNDIKYREVFIDSGSILSKLINLIYRLDYASIYVAVMSGVDPGPIKPIDFIKSKL